MHDRRRANGRLRGREQPAAFAGELLEPALLRDPGDGVLELALDRQPQVETALGAPVQKLEKEQPHHFAVEHGVDQVVEAGLFQIPPHGQKILGVGTDPDRLPAILVGGLQVRNQPRAPDRTDQQVTRSRNALFGGESGSVLEAQPNPLEHVADSDQLSIVEQQYRGSGRHRFLLRRSRLPSEVRPRPHATRAREGPAPHAQELRGSALTPPSTSQTRSCDRRAHSRESASR